MKQLITNGALFIAILSLGAATLPVKHNSTPATHNATCSGGGGCHACKNCKYSKHCAKEGGTCSVCKK